MKKIDKYWKLAKANPKVSIGVAVAVIILIWVI